MLTLPDGGRAILETDWDPKTGSLRMRIRIIDPGDTGWMDLPAEKVKVAEMDEKISKEIEKLARRPKRRKR